MVLYKHKNNRNWSDILLQRTDIYCVESIEISRLIYITDNKKFGLARDKELVVWNIEDTPKVLPKLNKAVAKELEAILEDMKHLKRLGVKWVS